MGAYMPQAKTVEWETPQRFYDALDREFHFTLDPCCTVNTAKCSRFFTKNQNGLNQSWQRESVYCNPPYGAALKKWVRKSYSESRTNPLPVVMLIPARTDTAWWHDYIMQADEIRFVRGRLKFGGCAISAPFPSVVVVFRSPLDKKHNKPACVSISRLAEPIQNLF